MPEKKVKILYIEDDPSSLLLVRRMLTYQGYDVMTATCGLEGIDVARREKPDLILVDINLPDMTGREVTAILRADPDFADIPIVALTSQQQAGDREMGLGSGMTGYLAKPLDIDKIGAQLAYYLRGGRDSVDETSIRDAQALHNIRMVTLLEQKVRELEISNAELRRLERVKDDFVQITAHELRTPLALINGYGKLLDESEAIQSSAEQNADVKLFLEGLVGAIDRMGAVLNEILTISRIATAKIELDLSEIDLAPLLQGIIDEFSTAITDRNLHLSITGSPWPAIKGDLQLLILAFRNLISNAIKYTPDGGQIHISYRREAHGVTISIADSGIGIAKDDLKRIFDRFVSTRDNALHSTSKTAYLGGGLGLGLAICRGVVEAHHGKIWAESPGRDENRFPGSIFHVFIPFNVAAVDPFISRSPV
jgi:signal transduction histidine kinase